MWSEVAYVPPDAFNNLYGSSTWLWNCKAAALMTHLTVFWLGITQKAICADGQYCSNELWRPFQVRISERFPPMKYTSLWRDQCTSLSYLTELMRFDCSIKSCIWLLWKPYYRLNLKRIQRKHDEKFTTILYVLVIGRKAMGAQKMSVTEVGHIISITIISVALLTSDEVTLVCMFIIPS